MAENIEEKEIGFKHWLSRTIMLGIILFILVYWIDQNTEWDIVYHTIVAVSIALFLGLFHEALHYYKAIKLGYTPKWFRTKFRVCFEVNLTGPKQSQLLQRKMIGIFPYIFIVPISLVILGIGVYLNHLGIIVGGVTSLLLHAVTFSKEGK